VQCQLFQKSFKRCGNGTLIRCACGLASVRSGPLKPRRRDLPSFPLLRPQFGCILSPTVGSALSQWGSLMMSVTFVASRHSPNDSPESVSCPKGSNVFHWKNRYHFSAIIGQSYRSCSPQAMQERLVRGAPRRPRHICRSSRETPNNRFERSRGRIFGGPRRESMICINQLSWSSAQSRVAQPHR
jgi:hypothetical protein